MASNRVYHYNNPKDFVELQKLLEDDDDEGTEDGFDDDIDTDSSEHVEEEVLENSDSEQSDDDASSTSDGETGDDTYVATRKVKGKVTDKYVWNKVPCSVLRKTQKHNIVTKLPGAIGNARQANTCKNVWTCLFDDGILDQIVLYTNQYIEMIQQQFGRTRDARKTDIVEMRAFIGLLYLAGLYKGGRLNLEDLWDTNGNGIELFRLTMSLRRFRFIYRCIRFDDRETRNERKKVDRLAPIREVFEMFVDNCTKSYSLSEYVTIDEKLEAFRGRCNFVQYIPSKPAKYGIKIFALADAKTYYTSKMEIYAGAQPDGPFSVSNKSTDVVKRLILPISKTGRNVTMDNWFCDVELMQELAKDHKLSLVGTLKRNKWQIPSEFKNLKRRDIKSSAFGFKKEGTLVSYMPKKNKHVVLISSMHFDAKIDENTGDQKKPEIITFYNQTKGGVDVVDKLCSSYNVARNTKRWPMVVFFSMLNVAGINSQIIYNSNQNECKRRRHFIRTLTNELVKEHIHRRCTSNTGLPQNITTRIREIFKIGNNSRNSDDAENVENTSSRKRCTPCHAEKRTRLTKYKCFSCGIYLCLQHIKVICNEECPSSNKKRKL